MGERPDIFVYYTDGAALSDPLGGEISADGRRETRQGMRAAELLLRRVLHGLGKGTEEIALGPHGKPRHPSVFFNLSHSGPRAALALSERYEVGCDIERIREIPEKVLRALFPSERACIAGARDPKEEFFRIWTGKESYLKWTGEGLSGLRRAEIDGERVLRDGIVQDCRLCRYRLEDFVITVCAERGEFPKNVIFVPLG